MACLCIVVFSYPVCLNISLELISCLARGGAELLVDKVKKHDVTIKKEHNCKCFCVFF